MCHLNIQVASLKDTISRKDMEIEQLQLVKAPKLSFDRNGMTKNTVNQPSQLLSDERILKASDRVLSDPQSYVEVNGNSDHNSPTHIAHVGLGEPEYEDNASDDGLSVGETENSTSDRTTEMTTERMYDFLHCRSILSILFQYLIHNGLFLSPSKDDYLLFRQLLICYCLTLTDIEAPSLAQSVERKALNLCAVVNLGAPWVRLPLTCTKSLQKVKTEHAALRQKLESYFQVILDSQRRLLYQSLPLLISLRVLTQHGCTQLMRQAGPCGMATRPRGM
ncbi:hypothetical protein PR202_gb01846 [Eleusine coracana subsp. coracana]|uniref:Uncharacterized protein n=1 Tax=Eleusine coracana subsp. coracana TaxID=191504 RepID=A0AAV5DW64_ELECO|nr:hypothetical protein PR202_gb01846 [Eleusine coracana subsp. coracana]